MYKKKTAYAYMYIYIYRVWDYLWFQASTRVLECVSRRKGGTAVWLMSMRYYLDTSYFHSQNIHTFTPFCYLLCNSALSQFKCPFFFSVEYFVQIIHYTDIWVPATGHHYARCSECREEESSCLIQLTLRWSREIQMNLEVWNASGWFCG